MSTGEAGRARVLVVHNAYQQRGGEDSVVEAEMALLREHGHAVMLYGRHNDEVASLPRWQLARDTVWSPRTTRDITRLVAEFRPDVVHVHNTLPLVSPSVHAAARRAGVPVVQTLHNFRLLCPQATLLREGRVCEDCLGRSVWRSVGHGCYRGSAVQTAVLASSIQFHRWRGTWARDVTTYIALNEFCRDKFVEGGLPAERIRVKPNFVAEPPGAPAERRGFLYVGRLSPEKGIGVLAEAMRLRAGRAELRVVGEGPMREALLLPGAQLEGALAPAGVYACMHAAEAMVIPSVCYESFPRTLVEAFACGLPVIASRLGAMRTLVDEGRTGLLFEPGNAEDLAAKLEFAASHPAAMRAMGEAARAHYRTHWTPASNHRQLVSIYDEARQRARATG